MARRCSIVVLAALVDRITCRRIKVASALGLSPFGQVDGLYTFGAPGSTEPALKNHRSDSGCFPGYRAYTLKGWGPLAPIDIVVPSAGLYGFEHPYQEALELNPERRTSRVKPCSKRTTGYPNGFRRKKIELHDEDVYVNEASSVNEFMWNISHVGLKQSYVQDEQAAADISAELGWNLVRTAFHDGKGTKGGYQVSHLIQQPDSLECIVTFQGTQSWADWQANLDTSKVKWCGLEQNVHRGFKDHLMRITGSRIWQKKIKTFLPSCSRVYAVGHSLGGAMAELFAGCVQRAPQEGEEGSEDWAVLGWRTDNPKRLRFVRSTKPDDK
jgi:hypothetical protein